MMKILSCNIESWKFYINAVNIFCNNKNVIFKFAFILIHKLDAEHELVLNEI